MRIFLREAVSLDRLKWKQTVIAMRLAQSEDNDAVNKALQGD